MRITTRKVVFASAVVSFLVAAGTAAYTTSIRPQEPQEPRKVHVPKRFLSEVKKLKVESHRIEEEGTPEARLVVVLRNKTDLGVTRVSVSVADLTVSHDGGIHHDEPVAVIEPYGTGEFTIPLTNFIDDSPLVISAAIYSDGTEEGREELLREARADWEEGRAARAAKRRGPEK